MKTPSLAVDLPGRRYNPADLAQVTRNDWIVSVCNEISEAGLTKLALIGHSSGGYVIPGVAARLSARPGIALQGLICVAATVPAEGKRPLDYLRNDLRTLAAEGHDNLLEGARGRTLGGLRDGEAPIRTSLEIVENGPRMGLEAPRPLFESFTWTGFPYEVTRFFVRCLRDKVIPPELADTMVENMGGATVIDLEACHRAFDTCPDLLADVIDRCCSAK